jgi:hypothetical protein
MVPCQGWLGEAGALWAHAIPAANNTPSVVTELVRDRFIPDATCRTPVESIPYRCIPQATVLHSQEENPTGQPDDSIPLFLEAARGNGLGENCRKRFVQKGHGFSRAVSWI